MLYVMLINHNKKMIPFTLELLQHSLSQTKRQKLFYGSTFFLEY